MTARVDTIFFPRLLVIVVWLAEPGRFHNVFDGFVLAPLMGLLFLPLTVLMYSIVWSPWGLVAVDWSWMVIALLLDVYCVSAAGYSNRQKTLRQRSV